MPSTMPMQIWDVRPNTAVPILATHMSWTVCSLQDVHGTHWSTRDTLASLWLDRMLKSPFKTVAYWDGKKYWHRLLECLTWSSQPFFNFFFLILQLNIMAVDTAYVPFSRYNWRASLDLTTSNTTSNKILTIEILAVCSAPAKASWADEYEDEEGNDKITPTADLMATN